MVAPKPIIIRKERFYPHQPEDVWVAITDPYAIAEWMEPNDHQPVVGHKFHFRCDPGLCGSGNTECEVLEVDPPRRLVWSWVNVPKDESCPRHAPMIIAWTLMPHNGGTKLILEHSGAENIGWLTRNMMRIGWGYMMKNMISRVLTHIEGGSFRPGAIPLNKRYYTCKSVPKEFVR